MEMQRMHCGQVDLITPDTHVLTSTTTSIINSMMLMLLLDVVVDVMGYGTMTERDKFFGVVLWVG